MIKRYISFTESDDYMSRHIKSREEFIKSISSFEDALGREEELVDWIGHEGYNEEEEAVEDLKDKTKEWEKLPNPFTAYRVVALADPSDLRHEDLGEHWTQYDWMIDGDLLNSIGDDTWEEDAEPYVITAKIRKEDVDVMQTIVQNLSFPNEHEINLKKGAKPEVISVTPFDDF
jgi:hypothetical protein